MKELSRQHQWYIQPQLCGMAAMRPGSSFILDPRSYEHTQTVAFREGVGG